MSRGVGERATSVIDLMTTSAASTSVMESPTNTLNSACWPVASIAANSRHEGGLSGAGSPPQASTLSLPTIVTTLPEQKHSAMASCAPGSARQGAEAGD